MRRIEFYIIKFIICVNGVLNFCTQGSCSPELLENTGPYSSLSPLYPIASLCDRKR